MKVSLRDALRSPFGFPVVTPALALPLLTLNADEQTILQTLRSQLTKHTPTNRMKQQYYEGVFKARNLDIAVPPTLADLDVHIGFPGIVVDVLAERIQWDGWVTSGTDLMGLDEVYRDNALDVEQAEITVDSLVAGVSFVSVGTGGDDEPDVLVTGESAQHATVLWDRRKRRVAAALSQTWDDFGRRVDMETLYLPYSTIVMQRTDRGGIDIVSRDDHGRGRVPVVRVPNRGHKTNEYGRSEITHPIRYWTDAAARTELGMEIHREFFTAPQRYGLGLDPEQFGITANSTVSEKVRKGWQASMSRMLFAPRDEETGDLPQVGQFAASPPTPYISQTEHYAKQISAESGIPPNYFGFTTQNPPSGDAIRALEIRLTKRAGLRQRMQGRSWREVAYLTLLWRDGRVDEDAFAKVTQNWLDPSTPTPAADMDETVKGIQAGIYPPESPIVARKVHLSQDDQDQLAADRRRALTKSVVQRLGAPQPAADPAAPPANRSARDTGVSISI